MSSDASTSLAAFTVTVTMDTTKMTNYHISVWTLTNAWKADLTVTNVLTWREGEKGNKRGCRAFIP